MWQKIKPYVLSVAIALLVGALSALSTMGSMETYAQIVQPPLAPPSVLFPIVWSILFVLMGISSALIYVNRQADSAAARKALVIYGVQLAVNFLWSLIFFNLQAYWFAFFWLLLLWVLILWMIIRFYKISPVAAYLQLPYFLWVTFAGYLTLAIAILN